MSEIGRVDADNRAFGCLSNLLFQHEGLEPAHVHIQRERALAKFWLRPVALAEASGFPARDLRVLARMVEGQEEEWLKAWHEYFER